MKSQFRIPSATHTLFLLALPAVFGACNSEVNVTTDKEHPYQYPVVLNRSFVVSEDPTERAEQESKIIERVIAMLPVARRPELRSALENTAMRPSGSDDPQIAELLGDLAAIRDVTLTRAIAEARIADAARRAEASDHVRITIALVESLPVANARAVVRRGAWDRGSPLLLLTSGASEEDVARGIAAAVSQFERLGARVTRDVKMTVRDRPVAPMRRENAAELRAYLTELHRTPPRVVPGLGEARAIEIIAPTRKRP